MAAIFCNRGDNENAPCVLQSDGGDGKDREKCLRYPMYGIRLQSYSRSV